jgi:hypothetical protein
MNGKNSNSVQVQMRNLKQGGLAATIRPEEHP